MVARLCEIQSNACLCPIAGQGPSTPTTSLRPYISLFVITIFAYSTHRRRRDLILLHRRKRMGEESTTCTPQLWHGFFSFSINFRYVTVNHDTILSRDAQIWFTRVCLLWVLNPIYVSPRRWIAECDTVLYDTVLYWDDANYINTCYWKTDLYIDQDCGEKASNTDHFLEWNSLDF